MGACSCCEAIYGTVHCVYTVAGCVQYLTSHPLLPLLRTSFVPPVQAAEMLDAVQVRHVSVPSISSHNAVHTDLLPYSALVKWLRDCETQRFSDVMEVCVRVSVSALNCMQVRYTLVVLLPATHTCTYTHTHTHSPIFVASVVCMRRRSRHS